MQIKKKQTDKRGGTTVVSVVSNHLFSCVKLTITVSGPSERAIQLAKVEIKRIVKEELVRLVSNDLVCTVS